MIGPKDGRRKRSRCEACMRRKIKCQGGIPCVYCVKKSYTCIPPSKRNISEIKFVHSATNPLPKLTRKETPTSLNGIGALHLSPKLPPSVNEMILNHFFTSFLPRNSFTGAVLPDLEGLVIGFQSAPSLYDAIIAVSALDYNRNLMSAEHSKWRNIEAHALAAYQASLSATQAEINGNTILRNEHALWTTFLLGLFELMYDASGEGWVKHILYGTSKLLQLRGPDANLSRRGRSFFLTLRAFEICRALIYNEETFLCESKWRVLTDNLWAGEFRSGWHPKEALLDLMVSCTALSNRVCDFLEQMTPTKNRTAALHCLIKEGHVLRTELHAWHIMFVEYTSTKGASEDRAQDLLSVAYYHASSIFLSGIFDYRPQFLLLRPPSLNEDQIQSHVRAILSSTEEALKTTNLIGILFFFPLRVAGARTRCGLQKRDILRMLESISKSSFVVADTFREDLSELWRDDARSSMNWGSPVVQQALFEIVSL